MRSVKIAKDELLAIVRENKTKHIATYNEAVEDYKALAIKLAAFNQKLAKSGDMAQIAKIRPMPGAPTSYESNYDRAIRMLELSVDSVIELQEDVFNQLVLDEWQWKNGFTAAATLYKSM